MSLAGGEPPAVAARSCSTRSCPQRWATTRCPSSPRAPARDPNYPASVPSPPITLSIQPSTAQYASGDAISLQLVLALDPSATASVTVCTFVPGSFRVLRLERNGIRLAPVRSAATFIEDPTVFQ